VHSLVAVSVADPDPDPGLGAILTPGSGIQYGRKSASGSGIFETLIHNKYYVPGLDPGDKIIRNPSDIDS
jgi:hypothetical protein